MQNVMPLRSAQPIVHINTLGAFLRYLREREQIPQSELVETFSYFFEEEHNIASLTADMYRKVEKGKRALQFEEILPLYAALVGSGFKISPQERGTYVRLARLKLETLRRKRPKLRPDSEWRLLELQLAQIDQQAKPSFDGEEKVERRRKHASLDTSHIVGRENWLARMLSYLDDSATSSKKLVTIQGLMGVGKTSGLKLLLQSLLEREECWPVLYSFSTTTGVTPADHLDTFLATILAELQIPEPEAGKTPPLAKRIEQLLKRLAETEQRIVLLVDDAQVILDEHGQLPPEWQHFFAEYLCQPHQTVLYLATRQWPFWPGRERSFLIDGDDAILPALDKQAGAKVWQRLGFTDVPEHLLQAATTRCGGNPLVIELRAANLQRPRFSFGWEDEQPKEEQKSEHQQLIEQLLKDTHIFSSADVEARLLLGQAIGGRLSFDALQLLEALAMTPLALPFPLLLEINQEAEYAVVELLQASLLDRNAMKQEKRAILQPLAREAVMHQLQAERRVVQTEQQLLRAYIVWLERGTFQSEQEQALLVSELIAAHLKQQHLLEAAELLIEYGWLSFAFGHAPRLARLTEEIMRGFNWHRTGEDEVGGLLLQYHLLARALDKDLNNAGRKQAYLHLYEIMAAESVVLKPRTIVHLVHHKLRYLIGAKQYEEAWTLIDEVCERYKDFEATQPAAYTDLLDRRAYVLGRWGDHQDAQAKRVQGETLVRKLQEEAFRLRREAVTFHQQCVALLQQQERFASPLEQSHVRFKRARLLNDLSYYQRVTGDLEAARQSMKDCLKLKEAGYVVPSSLAVSYDDYSQLLGQNGNYQEALVYSDRALRIMQDLADMGQGSALREKGMLLINRGKLLLFLGRLDEAHLHFTEGTSLVEGTSREVSAATALEGLRLIETWHKANPHHQLDWRWYPRYRQIASYSDVKWLTQSGPFTEAEKQEWESLVNRRQEADVAKRMSAIVAQSRKRELAKSYEEEREPCFHYPLIPQEEIQSRLASLSQLRIEIEQHEPNVIVRQFYLGAIDERLDELNMIAATGRQDDDAYWRYNQRLNLVPSMAEMELAIRQLSGTLRRGLQHNETEQLCRHIIQQTGQWLIKPMDLEPLDITPEQETEAQQTSADEAQKLFSPETVGRFFTSVFQIYRFPWAVEYDVNTDHARVSLNEQRLVLPGEGQWVSLAKIRELLAHEVEVHAFRSNAGEISSLAILSTGLQGFMDTEEGLAIYYAQKVGQLGSHKPNKTWIGTLATGLASGLVCEPFSFRQLLLFLEAVNILRSHLLAEKVLTATEIRDEARRSAQNRCLRTYRGVTNLAQPGVCSTKDSIYLRGYLSVAEALDENKLAFDRLMVGSVGLHHLKDLGELGIVKPPIPHKQLATDAYLEKYVSQFVD